MNDQSRQPANFRLAYLEYYVGMAKMVAYWHAHALGFRITAYAGPETGVADRVSYVLEKNDIRLVITSAASPAAYEILSFVDRHGNGVQSVALAVEDVEKAFIEAVDRGAVPLSPPETLRDEHGTVMQAELKFLDSNVLRLVDHQAYDGTFKPGFEPMSHDTLEQESNIELQRVDHLAYGVYPNEMERWSRYFHDICGGRFLQKWDDEQVGSEYSGMYMAVHQSRDKALTSVFVEPANNRRASQVEEYLQAFYGSGVQHVAFASEDIFTTVDQMRRQGVELVPYPATYYEGLRKRGLPTDLVDRLEEHKILCDRQGDSMLFQTFTKPFGDRPTLFYEVIQRVKGYEGFGQANIQALFEAVEQDQQRRMSHADG